MRRSDPLRTTTRTTVPRVFVSWPWICGAIVFSLTATCWSDNWPNWRGPRYSGQAEGHAYPTQWSPTSNVQWKLTLPGRSGSTPAVWGDCIYVTCERGDENVVIAVDRNGTPIWTTTVGKARPGKHRKASGANPSPTTDGESIYVYFKSGDLACLDQKGTIVWRHNLQEMFGEDTLWWDLGTSPVLTDSMLIVACMHSGPSYVAAFDKRDGKLVWKQDRIFPAPDESNQSYTTPALAMEKGQSTIIVSGADHVTSHALDSGREIWRVGGLNPNGERFFRSIASPVVVNGLVLIPYARGSTMTAIRLEGQGDVTDTHIAWFRDDMETDVPTAAVNAECIFTCSDRGTVRCLDVATGETRWDTQLPRTRATFSASPILAGNYLYLVNEAGTTYVIDVTQEGKLMATNELDEPTVATPVLVDGKIYLQTAEHLYCLAE